MKFNVKVTISLKEGMLNPEASTIERALALIGYEVNNTDTVNIVQFTMDAANEEDASAKVDDMCQRLLCNPVIQDYEIQLD